MHERLLRMHGETAECIRNIRCIGAVCSDPLDRMLIELAKVFDLIINGNQLTESNVVDLLCSLEEAEPRFGRGASDFLRLSFCKAACAVVDAVRVRKTVEGEKEPVTDVEIDQGLQPATSGHAVEAPEHLSDTSHAFRRMCAATALPCVPKSEELDEEEEGEEEEEEELSNMDACTSSPPSCDGNGDGGEPSPWKARRWPSKMAGNGHSTLVYRLPPPHSDFCMSFLLRRANKKPNGSVYVCVACTGAARQARLDGASSQTAASIKVFGTPALSSDPFAYFTQDPQSLPHICDIFSPRQLYSAVCERKITTAENIALAEKIAAGEAVTPRQHYGEVMARLAAGFDGLVDADKAEEAAAEYARGAYKRKRRQISRVKNKRIATGVPQTDEQE